MSDIPDDRIPDDLPAYGTDFGQPDPPEPSWVPPKATSARTEAMRARVPPAPVERVRPTPLRVRGVRVQAWHVVAVVVGLFIPLALWAAAGMLDDIGPVAGRVTRVTPHRPAVTRTFPATPATRATQAPLPTTAPTNRTAMTAPPLVRVPAVPVTPVPTAARTIRFEAQAQNGGRVEVSLSDATHRRHDFAVQAAPLAFELPVSPTASSTDYFSLRVRTADGTNAGDRSAVTCRILVDGVVVTMQQGRDSATCYLSPYYDILRR